MRLLILLATAALLGLTACATAGPNVPQDQAAQFQQAGSPYPYNSFYCP
jgi:outer membrane biogenesis lipoprotein LolB